MKCFGINGGFYFLSAITLLLFLFAALGAFFTAFIHVYLRFGHRYNVILLYTEVDELFQNTFGGAPGGANTNPLFSKNEKKK